MSILEDVLVEELERCERHKEAWLKELQAPDNTPERVEQLQKVLQRIEKDMRMLHRALGPAPEEMDSLLEKLNAASEAWKGELKEGAARDLPLLWTVDEAGMLYLDGVWICPAEQVDTDKLDDEFFVTPVSMELDLYDCSVAVVIAKYAGRFEIAGVERTITPKREVQA